MSSALTKVIANAISKATLTANSILYAVSAEIPAALSVAASRIVGRKASGDIAALTGAEAATVIGSDLMLKGDGTAGRVLRKSRLLIVNGTMGVGLKCTLTSDWNGDTIGVTDNIGKNATTGNFALSADGTTLTILNSGITGDVIAILGIHFYSNQCETFFIPQYYISSGICIRATSSTAGTGLDLTTLVDTGAIYLYILYVTSE